MDRRYERDADYRRDKGDWRDRSDRGELGRYRGVVAPARFGPRDIEEATDNERGRVSWPWWAAGALLAAAGGYLLYRGISSRRGSGSAMGQGRAIRIHHSILVDRPAQDLYRYWRDLENLPQVMSYLESVEDLGMGRSRWIAKGPAGTQVEWNAQIVDDRENRLLSWRAIEGSQVPNEGTVRFDERPGGETEIRVSLTYYPPGGRLGEAVAKMFGRDPAREIAKDLRRFKQKAETGQIMTSAYSRPSGREARAEY